MPHLIRAVLLALLLAVPALADDEVVRYVTLDGTPLLAEPRFGAAKVGELPKGGKVIQLSLDGPFAHVRYDEGKAPAEGYVPASRLADAPPSGGEGFAAGGSLLGGDRKVVALKEGDASHSMRGFTMNRAEPVTPEQLAVVDRLDALAGGHDGIGPRREWGRRTAALLIESAGGLVEDGAMAQRLTGIARKVAAAHGLAPGEYAVGVVNGEGAYATPGGYLLVGTGAVAAAADDDATLALLVATQLAHLTRNDLAAALDAARAAAGLRSVGMTERAGGCDELARDGSGLLAGTGYAADVVEAAAAAARSMTEAAGYAAP